MSAETPELGVDSPIDTLAKKAGLERTETERREVIILAMPNIREEEAKKFMATLEMLSPYLPFHLAVTYNRVSALTKEDLLEWRDRINHICEANGWSK